MEAKYSLVDESINITDKHGEILTVEQYITNDKQEERFQVYLDSEKKEIRNVIENLDLKLDLSKDDLMECLNLVLSAVTGENERTMVLSENEAKVVESMRKGANIELAFYNAGLNKKEAREEVAKFGRVKTNKTPNNEWYSSPINALIRVSAFYE